MVIAPLNLCPGHLAESTNDDGAVECLLQPNFIRILWLFTRPLEIFLQLPLQQLSLVRRLQVIEVQHSFGMIVLMLDSHGCLCHKRSLFGFSNSRLKYSHCNAPWAFNAFCQHRNGRVLFHLSRLRLIHQ